MPGHGGVGGGGYNMHCPAKWCVVSSRWPLCCHLPGRPLHSIFPPFVSSPMRHLQHGVGSISTSVFKSKAGRRAARVNRGMGPVIVRAQPKEKAKKQKWSPASPPTYPERTKRTLPPLALRSASSACSVLQRPTVASPSRCSVHIPACTLPNSGLG